VSFVPEPGFTGSPTPIPYVLTQISSGLSDTATITITYVASELTLVKTTPEEVVRRGALVPYTIRFRNGTAAAVGPISIVDTLPEGLVYVDGTAELDGVPVAVTVTGRTVTFPGVAVPANTEIVATLTARIRNGANPGAYVNTALALDPGSTIVAGPATATVRILPEAVFDCADVIGRVFEDLDGDGYQDPWTPDARPSTEEKLPGEAERNEVGLAGVRLVTLDGLVITTDANGLFSVPCAALPADRGSNFLLSLDTRTLPAGFEMTTENPRVMRLTPGMLTEMNFGARLARSIRVDLSAAAFPGGPSVGPELSQGIAAMVARLADEPMGVDLVFHVAADADLADVAAARAALDAVEAEIARQWSEVARGRLGISQTIARAGE
jgi:large repetitive protein